MPFAEDLREHLEQVERQSFDGFDHRPLNVGRYALELRLIRRVSSEVLEVTEMGHIYLRLRGADAVRWLLTLEVSQSLGGRDDWRAPRSLLEEALGGRGIIQEVWGEEFRFSFSDASLARLCRLGALVGVRREPEPDSEPYRFYVPELMRQVVVAVIQPGPWHAVVEALLQDERAQIVIGRAPGVASATVAQTRLIAHEVRNALVPVRHHIDALRRTGLEGAEERLDAVRRGVVRVLEFVDQLVATSELATGLRTKIELEALIREVLTLHEGAERIMVDVLGGPIVVRGPQPRLLRALSNLVHNALQSTPGGERIRVSVESSGALARLAVDDAGPGVPAPLRSRVFEDGYTTRAGGTGFGLAFVREVVEREFNGNIWCEDSSLGGARFVIELPMGEESV
ncbi:MAG: HAMP domain-containing sensor histidine kinase [Myxococcota bacterium]